MREKKIIDSRYKIEKKIGSGGSADVYLCTHLKLDMECAIKILNKDKNFFMDGKKEAFMLRDLNHPRIPKIFDILEDEENVYIVREYCKGLNLRESLNIKGPLQYHDLKHIAEQIADVLSFFHEKNPPIIYRDLKPDNIIIDDALEIKLIDLGISRTYDVNKEDDTRYIGSHKYAAPEQFGIQQSTIQTDVYSFALLLYFLYTAEDYADVKEELKWKKFVGKKGETLKNSILKAIQSAPRARHEDIPSLMREAFPQESDDSATIALSFSAFKQEAGILPKVNLAFLGLHSGVGTSHICLCISKSFSSMGYKVKLFDVSHKGGLEYLHAFQRGYDAFEKSNAKTFSFEGFEVVTINSKIPLTKMMSMNYEIGIFDFGASHSNCNDFLKMQRQFLILPASPYSIKENAGLIEELKGYVDVKYLLNLSNKSFTRIHEYLGLPEDKLHEIGFIDPASLNDIEIKYLTHLCLGLELPQKKRGIIKKLFA